MTIELHNTEVNMDGLLEVLGKNLYSSPSVAIRELVQNAHDACMRRKIEDKYEGDVRITLSTDANKQILYIEDSGSGLTYEEVQQYLATVGSGYTRLLRGETDSDDMIGYFGLGFLSAYVVAEKVEVWTTSYRTPNTGWHFTSTGGKRFTLEETAARAIGTRVKLKLSSKFAELSSPDVLATITRKYCCLLPIPIYLNGRDEALNNLTVPWRLDSDAPTLTYQKTRMAFAKVFEEYFDPICTLPLPSDNDFSANGLLWVQDSSGYSTSDYRNVSVFVRNMQITHEGRDLLPIWAGFIGCVVETTRLTPTASREDMQKDEHYYKLQQFLSRSLVAGLQRICKHEPENWRRIVTRHNQALMGAAVSEPALFDVLRDELKVPTSRGELSLPAVLEQSGNVIYIRNDEKNNYEEVLFRARMIPVVSGYMFAVAGFCEAYAQQKNLQVHYLGSQDSNHNLIKPLKITRQEHDLVDHYFAKAEEDLVICEFEPHYLPLLFMEDKEAKLKRDIEREDADKRIGSAALSLARLHTQTVDERNIRRTFINMKNPLVRKILEPGTSKVKQRVVEMMRSYMLTVCYDVSDDDVDYSLEVNQFFQGLHELALGDS